jgi:Family of unknown function (DUF6498)
MGLENEIQKLKESVLADPQNPEVWKDLAACLVENGQRRTALKAYRRSLELSGGDERALSVMNILEDLPVVQDDPNNGSKDISLDVGPLSGVTLPLWFQVFLGLFSFLLMLLTAVAQGWTATEMVWSLWISSLVLGYSFIITAILAMFFGGQGAGLVGRIASSAGSSALGLRLIGALFMLAFFSFHFLFFHFVHSIFLNQFFPLVRSDVFDGMGLGYFVNLISTCIRRFWPFVLTSAISQSGKYIRAFQQFDTSLLSMPYKNVVRMHLSIFVFAFLQITGVPSIALYFVMFVYFFPLRELWEFLRGSSGKVDGAIT